MNRDASSSPGLPCQSWFAEEGGVKQATRLSGGVSLAPRKGSCMFAC
jgi:hypothetical protein